MNSVKAVSVKGIVKQMGLQAPACVRLYHGQNEDARDNFLPENHPVILRHKDTNTYYLHPELVDSQRRLTHDPHDDMSVITEKVKQKSFIIDAAESPVRLHIRKQSNDLKKMMFFYNETNPHAGLIGNTRKILYDYYELIGPVKDSWYKVLSKDFVLSELLITRAGNAVELQAEKGAKPPTLSDIANMLDSLPAKKGASSCKYKSSVTDNLLLIHLNGLTESERVVLEVLAQYAFVDYEIVEH